MSAADAYAKMLRTAPKPCVRIPWARRPRRSNDAPRRASLDDIVLDFDPDLDVAEKLLLVGATSRGAGGGGGAVAEVTAVATRLYATWTWEGRRASRRASAREARWSATHRVAGPVFVKMAQTLSTRPDIIGDEAADALKPLQDQMAPFSSVGAYEQIREELRHEGPVHPGDETWRGGASAPPLYAELSAEPVAAASIGQVYKGVTVDGREVAVKVQRPGVLRQIAMDLHIARITLIWIEESGLNGATDLANIVDRVGRGIFQELDYTLEASNADEFRRSLRFMDFLVVPRHLAHMTGRRVLTQEWIDGRPMKDLTTEEQLKMVQWGVECSARSCSRTGLVHADPHEGNMLYTDEGKLALDFGLICRVTAAAGSDGGMHPERPEPGLDGPDRQPADHRDASRHAAVGRWRTTTWRTGARRRGQVGGRRRRELPGVLEVHGRGRARGRPPEMRRSSASPSSWWTSEALHGVAVQPAAVHGVRDPLAHHAGLLRRAHGREHVRAPRPRFVPRDGAENPARRIS